MDNYKAENQEQEIDLVSLFFAVAHRYKQMAAAAVSCAEVFLMYNRVREIPRTYADMGYRLQRFRVILMASIAIMIVVMAVCLFVHPTSGGALLVLALGGSLAALILDYRRRSLTAASSSWIRMFLDASSV